MRIPSFSWIFRKHDVLLVGENDTSMSYSFMRGNRRFVRQHEHLDYVTELKEDGTTAGQEARRYPRWEELK
jgi:hypothetical protein